MRSSPATAGKWALGWCVSGLLALNPASAQFIDKFDGGVRLDPSGANGWTFKTGDGIAVMDFRSADGLASVTVDATSDKRGIWWALIRRRISQEMNLSLLRQPNHALRVEACIRVSDAPKRVNLHLNTQRTRDFHSHLMEFDIPDTLNWYTISMTTDQFDAIPGDSVYAQLALMDWGLDRYRVDLKYFKADIVNVDSAGPDTGDPIPFHPPVRDPRSYAYHLPVAQDGMIDLAYPDMGFHAWSIREECGRTRLLAVGGTQFAIFRWDLSTFAGGRVSDSGMLELATYSVERSRDSTKDFGMVRVSEILGGDPVWKQESVTYNSLRRGQDLNRIVNSQMIIDVEIQERRGARNLITISKAVLQRMIDGKTLGLAVRPLGAVHASFYAMENQAGLHGATLDFTLDPP